MSTFDERYRARRDTVPTEIIAAALEIIAGDIHDDEGTTRGALHEAAERLRKLEAENAKLKKDKELRDSIDAAMGTADPEKEVQP